MANHNKIQFNFNRNYPYPLTADNGKNTLKGLLNPWKNDREILVLYPKFAQFQ